MMATVAAVAACLREKDAEIKQEVTNKKNQTNHDPNTFCKPVDNSDLFIFHRLTHFKEPAFSVWIKKRQRQVVPIILWDFERLAADARVQFLEDKFQKSDLPQK